MNSKRIVWWVVFLLAILPSAYLLIAFFFFPRSLGVDPVEVLLQQSGLRALRLLLITLACSPLKRAGWKSIVRFRRMLGLYTFYYASLHLMTYVIGWIELDGSAFLEDVIKRPFIYIGMFTWVVLAILAITSPKWVVKKLKRRWVTIHKGVFIAVVAAWIHLWMQSRASAGEPLIYLAIISLLLGERLYRNVHRARLVNLRS